MNLLIVLFNFQAFFRSEFKLLSDLIRKPKVIESQNELNRFKLVVPTINNILIIIINKFHRM